MTPFHINSLERATVCLTAAPSDDKTVAINFPFSIFNEEIINDDDDDKGGGGGDGGGHGGAYLEGVECRIHGVVMA
eukprot:scaffold47783_cov30-Prasinocladus_malaysianus.AAC.1